MKTIEIKGEEFATRNEAVYEAVIASCELGVPMRAITVGGKNIVCTRDEMERIEAAGVPFAILSLHEATQRLMTIPVN
jgi:hypothetical protein